MNKAPFTALAITAALLSAGPSPARAQLLTYGGYAGLNFSNLDISQIDPNQAVKSSNGFMLGGWFGLNLSRQVTVQVMGYFTRKGAQVSDSSGTGTLRTDYFQFPVVAKWNLPIMLLRPHLYAGPSAAFLANCEVKIFSGTVDCGNQFDIQNADFSAIIGGGVWVGPLLIDVQYDIGLSDINADPTSSSSVKNRTWTILVGLGV